MSDPAPLPEQDERLTEQPLVGRPIKPRSGGVQSIERAFGLLETMADHGGVMGLSHLATESGLPLPTIHRLVRTLVGLGFLRQEPSRQYVLGPRLIRLGEASSKTLSIWARPHLERLVAELGESANLALLDGDQVVYVAQAQSHRSMRMFTDGQGRCFVGGRLCNSVRAAGIPLRPARSGTESSYPVQTRHPVMGGNPAAFSRYRHWPFRCCSSPRLEVLRRLRPVPDRSVDGGPSPSSHAGSVGTGKDRNGSRVH